MPNRWKGYGGGGRGDWQEDQISIAVSQALAPILPKETEWDQAKLEKRVKQYFRNAAKGLEFYSKTWDALIEEYSDTVFASLFQALKDRPWLPEVDFLMVIDAAVKELFPAQLLRSVPQNVFEQQVLHAHDRAFEEQRFAPMLWDILFEKIQDKPLKSKVYNAFEVGRREAALSSSAEGTSPAEDFVRAWVVASLRELQQGPVPLGQLLAPELCKDIFRELLEAGALPLPLTEQTGVPPGAAELIDAAVEDVYSGHVQLPPAAAGKGKGRAAETRPKSAAAPALKVFKDATNTASRQQSWQSQGGIQKRPLDPNFGAAKSGNGMKWPRTAAFSAPRSAGHPLCTQQEDCIGRKNSVLVQHIANNAPGDLYCTHCWAVFADADVTLEAIPYET